LDRNSLNYFIDLMQQIKMLVTNEELYQLLLLVSLLDTDGLDERDGDLFSRVVTLRQTYLRLFQRKFGRTNETSMDYATFKRATESIKVVARILDFFNDF
jgi:hypothetical protein